MKNYIKLLIFVLVTSLVTFYCITKKIINMNNVYYLPWLWIGLFLFKFKPRVSYKFNWLIPAHFLAIILGIFSFLLYHQYLSLKPVISIKSNDFSSLNSLMFNSENALYATLYIIIFLFFVDLILLIKFLSNKNKTEK